MHQRAPDRHLSVAVGLGVIVGPSQVGARLIEMLAGSRYYSVWTMVVSAVLVAIAALMLTGGFPIVALAIALYGAGNGIGSIARGTVPLALFGPQRRSDSAISPFIGALIFQKGGADWILALVTAIALANVVLVSALRMLTWRHIRESDFS